VALPPRVALPLFAAVGFLIALAPTPPPAYVWARREVAFLRSLGIRERVVILETEFSRAFLAGLPFEHVAQWEKKDEAFAAFLDRRGIDLVVLNGRLREDTRFRDDPEFGAFAGAVGRWRDFAILHVPDTGTWIAVRDGLLPRR
jgi:hypothetical protein